MSSTVTVKDLNELVELIQQKEQFIESVEKAVSKVNADIEALYVRGADYLKELGQTSFKTPTGTLMIKKRTSWKTPKGSEQRAAFFAWLREKGIFDATITVNSQTLNSLANSELEEAEARGEDLVLWEIPGLDKPTTSESTQIRKA